MGFRDSKYDLSLVEGVIRMTLENKCKITTEGNKIIIEVTSNGHPLDEVIAGMFRGLAKAGMTTS